MVITIIDIGFRYGHFVHVHIQLTAHILFLFLLCFNRNQLHIGECCVSISSAYGQSFLSKMSATFISPMPMVNGRVEQVVIYWLISSFTGQFILMLHWMSKSKRAKIEYSEQFCYYYQFVSFLLQLLILISLNSIASYDDIWTCWSPTILVSLRMNGTLFGILWLVIFHRCQKDFLSGHNENPSCFNFKLRIIASRLSSTVW